MGYPQKKGGISRCKSHIQKLSLNTWNSSFCNARKNPPLVCGFRSPETGTRWATVHSLLVGMLTKNRVTRHTGIERCGIIAWKRANSPQIRWTKTHLGKTLFPENGETVDSLLRAADPAHYCVKANGRDRVHWKETLRSFFIIIRNILVIQWEGMEFHRLSYSLNSAHSTRCPHWGRMVHIANHHRR